MNAEQTRLLWAIGATLVWLSGTLWIVFRQWRLQRASRAEAAHVPEVVVAFASQTGFAELLAQRSADTLRAGGLDAVVRPLCAVTTEVLSDPRLRYALFVVSTYGEGDPPDVATVFARQVLAHPAQLPHLEYAVLALGDSSYQQFCGFGRRLDDWLVRAGARALAPRLEVDNADAAALACWQARLTDWGGVRQAAAWHLPALADWRIVERVQLNPGSPGAPAWLLKLRPAGISTPLTEWQAGDLVEIQPPLQPDRGATPTRRYSIASIPAEGALWLLVRQQRNADGRPGWCSDWLCRGAMVGETAIPLRVLSNPGFRLLEAAASAPLILIGNGTGLAGLRALLRQRVADRRGDNWLLFGERSPLHDAWLDAELRAWVAQGLLRVERAWSRADAGARYVQELIAVHAGALRDAVLRRGACVHVCGSLQGMAPAVHAALETVLEDAGLEGLIAAGRYRRDVY